MKLTKVILITILAFVSSNNIYGTLKEKLKESIINQKKSYPSDQNKYVRRMNARAQIIQGSTDNVDTKCKQLSFNWMICNKLKFAKNTKEYVEFNNFKTLSTNSIEGIFGMAFYSNGQTYYYIVKGNASANTIQQYKDVHYKTCKKVLFWTNCSNHVKKAPRQFNYSESQIIIQSLEAELGNAMVQKLL